MSLIQSGLIVLTVCPPLATLLLAYQIMRAGNGIIGKPGIQPILFYATKLITGLIFATLLVISLFPDFFQYIPYRIQNEIPDVQKMMCLIFLFAGNILLLPAYYTMSIFTRVGLPEDNHVLQTEGVFRVSRNPMYTSFFFFFSACFLLVSSVLLLALIIFNLVLNHRIILKEEAFLESTFGKQYLSYKNSVARYL